MGSEMNSDKLTIKNILFTKALPNLTIPVATEGYKIFPCRDCGDKFIFESSYNDHINRKSLKISYFCRHCNSVIVNNNRCKLLSHIRSHAFKTTTINVSDLKIEPLPIQDINWTLQPSNDTQVDIQTKGKDCTICYECHKSIKKSDKVYCDRAIHYMEHTNMIYSCPVCLFSLPSICALTAHLRIHLKVPPFFCPECGIRLSVRNTSYPYNHDCEGFNMIRATTRLICKQQTCNKVFHPNDYRTHIKNHIRKVYKCQMCSFIWIKPPQKHYPCNNNDKIIEYYQCQLCTNNKLLVKNEVNNHLNFHVKYLSKPFNEQVYPCMSCNIICNEVTDLINHQISKHASNEMKNTLVKILNEKNSKNNSEFYRVKKKCDKCLRSFLYRCHYANIKSLPNECPYKCTSKKTNENQQIVCYLCKNKISENWNNIKNHFATFHKNHKCLDLKVMLKRIDNTQYTNTNKNSTNCVTKNTKINLKKKKVYLGRNFYTEKRNEPLNTTIEVQETTTTTTDKYVCNICSFTSKDNQAFENHIIEHRDPCMAYQCLECGQSFVVKPSFSTHLLLEHGIANVNDYITNKQCYNESALLKQPNIVKLEDEPVKENQCKICRDQFENIIDLEKHFRVHGMAFLMKNTNKNNSP